VANASATYQTKAVERAALANTNSYIATKAAASNPSTSGVFAHTGRATISTNLSVSGNTTFGAAIIANNSTGTAGHYLRTSGTGVYWSPVAAGSSGASWSALTSTNTALRTLISDRLQVANASSAYVAKSGSTMTGKLTIQGNRLRVGESSDTVSWIEMMDDESSNGLKYIHANSNLIGFVGGPGSWIMYVNSSGQIYSSSYGWLHDAFFSAIGNCAPAAMNCTSAQGDMNYQFSTGYDPTGNCYNGPGNCLPTVANCGNTTRIHHVLIDGGSTVSIQAYRYNFNCNCNCQCC
jgi:hypothetical protein